MSENTATEPADPAPEPVEAVNNGESTPTEDATDSKRVSVLFVCLGNICRSPMAEAVFRDITQHPPHPLIAYIDSAGTGAYHIGSSPDQRTLQTLSDHGINEYIHAARQVREFDFEDYDWILGMDHENVSNLRFMKARLIHRRNGDETGLAQVRLFGQFGARTGGRKGEEVEDPYYGGKDGFSRCYEQMGRFSRAFIAMLEEQEKEDIKL